MNSNLKKFSKLSLESSTQVIIGISANCSLKSDKSPSRSEGIQQYIKTVFHNPKIAEAIKSRPAKILTTTQIIKYTLFSAGDISKGMKHYKKQGRKEERKMDNDITTTNLGLEVIKINDVPSSSYKSRARELYYTNDDYRIQINNLTCQAIMQVHRSRQLSEMTIEELHTRIPYGVEFFFRETDYFFDNLRKDVRNDGYNKVIFVYHGHIPLWTSISSGEFGDWGIPFSDVDVDFLSVPVSSWLSD